jgi:inosine/xanthosine triphosphate pyrophosphatase family protein
MTENEKNALSHRARAFRRLRRSIEDYFHTV